MDAIEWLLKIPSEHHDRLFISESASGNKLTFTELNKEACIIAEKLQSNGFQRGDRIAFFLNNSLDYVKLYFACLYSGIVVVPINPIFSTPEVEYIISHSQAKALFLSPKTGKIDLNVFEKNLKIIHLVNGGGSDYTINKGISWDLATFQAKGSFEPFDGINEEDELIVVYTSGTTAKPKGVIHKISNLVNNAREFGRLMGIGKKNLFYSCYSMSSLLGYYNLLLLPYINGSSVVLTEEFRATSLVEFWDTVICNKVNTLWLVPTIISMLLEIDRDTIGIDYCKQNEFLILTGTAPLAIKIRQDFENKYGVTTYDNYALSETLFITTNLPKSDPHDRGAGSALPKVKIKIIDSEGEDQIPNNEGEVVIQSPYLMKGYYEAGQNDLIGNEWFETGDLGYITEESQLHITGRKKDLIIRGGFNISPASIEEHIYQHPSILECAVVGIPDQLNGEKIIGVIKCDSSKSFDLVKEELTQLCQTQLPKVKQPSKFVELSEFPKTYTGKIQKVKLREWLKNTSDTTNKSGGDQKENSKSKSDIYYRSSKVVSDALEAISVTYNCSVYEMKQLGIDVITLSLGESYFDIPLYSFETLPFPELYHYSHSRGIIDLRQKLSQFFKSQYEVSFDPETEIIITAGSKIAIYMALLAVINPGDEVIVYDPAWVSYPEQIKLCYGTPVCIPYYEDVFDFEKYITNRTKVIIINNPNNPSGRVFDLEELSHLYHLARKYNLFILSDEAYSDFVSEKHKFISAGNFDSELEHTILVNSISKNFGISGWRVGYVITNSSLTNQLLKLNQNLITCPPTILANYVSGYFDDIIKCTLPQISELLKKRHYFSNYMDEIGLKSLPGTATFYFFVSIDPSLLTSIEFCDKLLAEDYVCTVPGIGYGQSCDKFIRVSIGTEKNERIIKGLQKIKMLIEKTSS